MNNTGRQIGSITSVNGSGSVHGSRTAGGQDQKGRSCRHEVGSKRNKRKEGSCQSVGNDVRTVKLNLTVQRAQNGTTHQTG